MLREIGHVQGMAHALNNLGSVRQHLGLLAEALPTTWRRTSTPSSSGTTAWRPTR